MEIVKGLYDWVLSWSNHPLGSWALFGIAFTESSCFPIPPDVLQIAMSVSNPAKSLYFALISSIGSIAGGLFGYFIGLRGGRPLLIKWVNSKKIEMVEAAFQKWGGWAVGVSAFTPIPYKVFTIAAGTFKVDIKTFIIASTIGRAGRFFLVGILFYFFGEEISKLIKEYFNIVSILFAILLIGGFWLMNHLRPREMQKDAL